jgi:DNA-binding MarR family transcriptional regulator
MARLLDRTLAAVEAHVRRGMAERGFPIEQVYLPVVRNVDTDGSRISDIATRAGLAKQTVGPLVRDLVERGVLRIDPDPTDGRAKIVRFTPLGLEGLAAGLDAVADVERRCAHALDAGGVARLKDDLRSVLDALEEAETG